MVLLYRQLDVGQQWSVLAPPNAKSGMDINTLGFSTRKQSRAERRAAQAAQRKAKAMARMTENACEVVLVGHGETEWNREGRLQGQSQEDPILNARGQAQAAAVAQWLSGQAFGAIVSSDLRRAVQTAELIAKQQGLQVQINSAFRERNLGVVEGLTINEVRQKYPEELHRVKNGAPSGGETKEAAIDRAMKACKTMALKYPGGRVCVVTHGGTLRGIYERVVGLPSKNTVANAALGVIRVEGEFIDLSTWGEVHHLETAGLYVQN